VNQYYDPFLINLQYYESKYFFVITSVPGPPGLAAFPQSAEIGESWHL
jgi:hypothetical protein